MRPGQPRNGLPCDRCGIRTTVERRKGSAVGCIDCRRTDPAFFDAVRRGVRAA